MKHLILTLLLGCTGLLTFSQTNDWAPVGAKWWYGGVVGTGGPSCDCGYTTFESVADTMIKGKNCRKLVTTSFGCNVGVTLDQSHFMYEDAGKVYHYSAALDRFYTLYDFTLQAGDTLFGLVDTVIGDRYFSNAYGHQPPAKIIYKIIDVDTIEIDGVKRKRQYVTCVNLPSEPFVENWGFSDYLPIIEGIGSTYRMFGEIGCAVGSLCEGKLRCYSDGAIQYSPFNKTCDYILGGEVESIDSEIFKIVRAGNNHWIRINSPNIVHSPYMAFVYSLTGKLLYKKELIRNDIKLPVYSAPAVVVIQTSEKIELTKIIFP